MGSMALELVATVGGRDSGRPVERLTSPAVARTWLLRHGLVSSAAPAPGPDELGGLLGLREAVYRIGLALVDGTHPSVADIDLINRRACRELDLPLLELGSDGLQRTSAADAGQALGDLARDAIALLTGPHASQLRRCRAGGCSSLFVDASGRRTYCTSRCATRERVAAHRAAHG